MTRTNDEGAMALGEQPSPADQMDDLGHGGWVEIGFAADGTKLFHREWADERVAAWRAFGWILTNGYTVAYTDTNTMEMRRTDPERMCQRMVLARANPYLGEDGAAACGARAWPGEQPLHALTDPMLAGDRAGLRAWLVQETARNEQEVASWRMARDAWRAEHGRDWDPFEDAMDAEPGLE